MVQADAAQLLLSYPEHRVAVYRNVTIRGERATTKWDVAFLKRRIGLEAGVVVTLESLFILNSRAPSATSYGSLDIFSMSPTSVVVMRNMTNIYPLCIPGIISVPYTTRLERPPGYPGNQSAIPTGPVCFPEVGTTPNCFNESVLLVDLAMPGSTIDASGMRMAAGVILEYNVTYVCEYNVPASCIMSKAPGTAACTQQTAETYKLQRWDTYDLIAYPPPPAPVSAPQPRNGPPLLAIILPCVLGGTALLAAVAGIAWWWRGRRKGGGGSGGGPGDGTQKGYSKASNGMSHGSATERCESGLGPVPDAQRILLEMEPQNGATAAAVGTAVDGGGANGFGANGTVPWVGSGSGGSPKWSTGAAAGTTPKKGNGNNISHNNSSNGNPSGMGMAVGVVTGGRSTTLSSVHSGCTGATPTASNGGYGGGVAVDMLLGNPLLAPPGGKGSSCSSGSSIALNMVLGVDVFASREAVVGRGSFATVLEGHLGGRPVAVKLFHRDALGGTADDVKSLKQEIAILARCQHPNVVALLGAGSTTGGDEVFLVEELMISNLSRACHEGEGLPLQRVLSVARDVAAGLAYLHPTVIHRDLKPANVLLDQYGTAKLTDFGLSRLWASTVHTANPEAGTVQYMAPECFSGSISSDTVGKTPITHLSDIYSFGVLLWEMLTKERPWKGMSSIQVALAVGFQQQRLRVPDGDSERFHPKLRKLILQCWDADPRKRPGAAEIAKRLSLLLQHLETHGSLSAPPGVQGVSTAASLCSETATGAVPAPVSGGPVSGAPVSSGSLAPVTAAARRSAAGREGAGRLLDVVNRRG